MAKTFSLSVIFKTVDQATAPVRRISASLKGLATPIKKVGDAFKKMGRMAKSALDPLRAGLRRGAMALMALGAAAMYAFFRFTKLADSLGKTATMLGVTTDQLQAWRFAAQQSGVEVEQFDKALTYFNRIIGDTKDGLEESLRPFQKLKIGLYDNNKQLKSAGVLLEEVADKIIQVGDPADRLAILSDLFGARTGAKFMVMLKDGAKGLEKFREELTKRGGIVPEDVIRNSEKFNDAINLAKLQIRGLIGHALKPIMPEMVKLVRKFQDWLVEIRKPAIKKLTETMQTLMENTKKAWEHMKEFFEVCKEYRALEALAYILERMAAAMKAIAKYTAKGAQKLGTWSVEVENRRPSIELPKYIGSKGFIDSLKEGWQNITGQKTEVDIRLHAEPGTSAVVEGVRKGDANVNVISEGYLRTFGRAL